MNIHDTKPPTPPKRPHDINSPEVSSILPTETNTIHSNDTVSFELAFIELHKAVRSDKSNQLNIEDILPFINDIILHNNTSFIQYVCNRNPEFKLAHDGHRNNRKMFHNLDYNQSFALSWLMYLYH